MNKEGDSQEPPATLLDTVGSNTGPRTGVGKGMKATQPHTGRCACLNRESQA